MAQMAQVVDVAAVAQIAGAVLLVAGTAVCLLGVFGLIRLPDAYNRIHAAGMITSLGAELILLSLLFLAPARAGVKGVATALFLLLTAPMVTHVLARAAHREGVPLAGGTSRDDLAEDERRQQSAPGIEEDERRQ